MNFTTKTSHTWLKKGYFPTFSRESTLPKTNSSCLKKWMIENIYISFSLGMSYFHEIPSPTPAKTSIFSENRPSQKEHFIFQSLIFRCFSWDGAKTLQINGIRYHHHPWSLVVSRISAINSMSIRFRGRWMMCRHPIPTQSAHLLRIRRAQRNWFSSGPQGDGIFFLESTSGEMFSFCAVSGWIPGCWCLVFFPEISGQRSSKSEEFSIWV